MPEPDLDDLEFLDGGQIVTVTQAGTLTEQTVAGALKRPLSLREIDLFAGTLTHGDAKFNLAVSETSFAPAVGDTLSDSDGRDWEIEAVDLLSFGTRYRCWCKAGPTV